MRYGSVCSGIEAASVAWHPLGWEAAWLAEIEPFPSAVLAHHYPNVPNLGDMTRIAGDIYCGAIEAPGILVGGTPCQAFSVAGMRRGLDDARGQLTIKYVELANAIDDVRIEDGQDECIVVWENVPGVLSSKDNAFGCFLGALAGEECELQPPGGKWKDAGCVFGPQRAIAWRVLDAQYFGVAQRRRRVFVVASARDRFDPAAVLFEREGTRRDSPPGREEKSALHPTLTAQGGGALDDREAYVLESDGVRRTSVIEWERCQGFPDNFTLVPVKVKRDAPAGSGPCAKQLVTATVVDTSGNHYVSTNYCRAAQASCPRANMPTGVGYELCRDVCDQPGHAELGALRLAGKRAAGATLYVEGHTYACDNCKAAAVAAGVVSLVIGKPPGNAADGPRYKALGNSMAVPCMAWIGQRIRNELRSEAVDDLI